MEKLFTHGSPPSTRGCNSRRSLGWIISTFAMLFIQAYRAHVGAAARTRFRRMNDSKGWEGECKWLERSINLLIVCANDSIWLINSAIPFVPRNDNFVNFATFARYGKPIDKFLQKFYAPLVDTYFIYFLSFLSLCNFGEMIQTFVASHFLLFLMKTYIRRAFEIKVKCF